jgi:hypothetical protein
LPSPANAFHFQRIGIYVAVAREHSTLFLAFSHYTTTKFQKEVYYSGIKIFNNLPHNIKDLANEIKLFLNALKRFLLSNSFYNSEEYFDYQR